MPRRASEPSKKLRRNNVFRTSAADDVVINDNIKKSGLPSPSAYFRHVALHGTRARSAPAASSDTLALLAMLNSIGVELGHQGANLNQLAYKANATGKMDADAIEAALAENAATRARLDAALQKILRAVS